MDWVEIFAVTQAQEYKAFILKGLLEENGIETMVMNNIDSMYHFGEIKLLVAPQNVELAKQLITQQEENN